MDTNITIVESYINNGSSQVSQENKNKAKGEEEEEEGSNAFHHRV